MSSDPWTVLLEEYWESLDAVRSTTQAKALRKEFENRLTELLSSLDLLDDLNHARDMLNLRPEDRRKLN